MLLVRLPFRKSCRHRYLVTVLSAFLVFCIALMSGLVDRLLQESYSDDSFLYPLNVPNFRYLIENVKMHRALVARNGGLSDGQLDNILQGTPKPLNNFTFNYVISSHDKCNDSLHQPHSSFKVRRMFQCFSGVLDCFFFVSTADAHHSVDHGQKCRCQCRTSGSDSENMGL